MKSSRPNIKVYAIDTYDGRVGALDQGISEGQATLQKFKQTIVEAGLTQVVQTIQQTSPNVHWEQPIGLLLIDGLHDYVNVARDFFHFDPWVVNGGYIAFHDYADYFPGVKTFVREILNLGQYRQVHLAGTLIVVQKRLVLDSAEPKF